MPIKSFIFFNMLDYTFFMLLNKVINLSYLCLQPLKNAVFCLFSAKSVGI